MPLISIVIPCYNVEDYIDRCMKTLVNQTIGIENLEIILINDASTDSTYEKLCQWEQKYPEQIMVISYDENLRQGGARNIGIQYATADYIGFVDSDDWVELDMYEILYNKVKENSYDVVRGKFVRESYQGQINFDDAGRCDQEYYFDKKADYYNHIVDNVGNVGNYGGIWSAIYRKCLIVDNNVWFPEKLAYEDNFWGNILNLYVGNMYIVDKIVYHYFVNMSSTVTTRNSLHQLDRLKIEVMILEEYKKKGIFDSYSEDLEWNFIEKFYLNTLHIIFTRFDILPDVFDYMRSEIFKWFPNYANNPKVKKCAPIYAMLLSLLNIPGGVSVKELENIRSAYLEFVKAI